MWRLQCIIVYAHVWKAVPCVLFLPRSLSSNDWSLSLSYPVEINSKLELNFPRTSWTAVAFVFPLFFLFSCATLRAISCRYRIVKAKRKWSIFRFDRKEMSTISSIEFHNPWNLSGKKIGTMAFQLNAPNSWPLHL